MSNFYALINRLKYIPRWGLMRQSIGENVLEHTCQTAMLAHALAVINNEIFKGDANADKCASIALFHDVTEALTGDMPTPIKYNNPAINKAYKDMEKKAADKLVSMLPAEFKPRYSTLLNPDSDNIDFKIVKAADKLSAYIKCMEEVNSGNSEFSIAEQSVKQSLLDLGMREVDYFMDNFLDGFGKPLDSL